ncbi:MAG TPA: lysylphosphatidylglycerol synthase transmembrane domain-containing protein [Candidatus Koribacter sp.]
MSSSPILEEKKKSSRVLVLLSFPLAALFLYLALRKVDWHQVWAAIAHCRPQFIVASMVVSATSYFMRGLRWRVLLNTQAKLPVLPVFWANCACYFGNNVLPARAGELIRTAMVSSRSQLSKTFVLTTALSERVMDLIVLVTSGTLVIRFVQNKPSWLEKISGPLLALAIVAAILLISVPLFETLAERLLAKMHLPENAVMRLDHAIEHVAAGVRAFHDPSTFSIFFALTIGIWSCDAYAAQILAPALGLHMSFPTALLLLVGLGLGSALPSTPGYIGIYQFVAVTVLIPFHFTRADAIAYILVAQAGGLVVTGVLGSIGLLQYRKLSKTGALAI